MAIRKVTFKERKRAGNIYCPYCKPEKVNAIYRLVWFASLSNDFACEKHKSKLKKKSDAQDRDLNNTNYTEADYQSWLRL